MRYLAIGYWLNDNETFTISRPTDSVDKDEIAKMLCEEAKCPREHIDTILLVRNGIGCMNPPEVFEHWRGEDFTEEDNTERFEIQDDIEYPDYPLGTGDEE